MFSEEDVKELLQEAYEKGFNDGIDQTCDYICENYDLDSDEEAYSEDCFDLEDDYKYYTEMDQRWKDAYHAVVKKRKGTASDLEKKHWARGVAALDLSSKYAKKEKGAGEKTVNSLQRAKNNIAFADIIHMSNNEPNPEKRAKAKAAVDKVIKTNPHYGNKIVKNN
ncbi:MAG: hypothetical protein IJ193_00445 [Bacilli bacterium]|nr:hypothetical protein [Bacilli bacterium]